ncbi:MULTISPECIES: toprim domain-containing protein [Acetobacteraceae]|nr:MULTISPECIES: toprim domain-containing protein [Acetobacteraceae]ASL41738.1 DNA primase [Acetobacter oryzifermentans]ATJ92671.1 DNA primase [Acetobacter tropicalis]KAA8385238.1 DNA primase [Acetobacter tropicalis]KAA8386572.1 DNA primase [Acetobacter sp. DmW_136]KAA8389809.1 DNA primase [Acetobacter tropicalis]
MAEHDARDLSRRLAENAEAVCRHYLSAGRRHGNYWLVGDVRNTPGRSLYVRLHGPSEGRGAAGRWTDASTGAFGDLLDLIRDCLGLIEFRDVADEARSFLALPQPEPDRAADRPRTSPSHRPGTGGSSTDAARRLWDASRPLSGVAAVYLRGRDLTRCSPLAALRFHPDCYYRADADSPPETWPAMIAAVTDLGGRVTGVHRTWLACDGRGKAPVAIPRRAMGDLLGHAVRFGAASDALAAGEGIETVLSLREVMPDLPLAACLSSAHLAAMAFPPALRRLYVLRDDDPAGDHAVTTLLARTQEAGIECLVLSPRLADFNDDLRYLGRGAMRAILHPQLAPQDVARFLQPVAH